MPNEDALWDRFMKAIETDDCESVAYVYKTDRNGRPITPFWFLTYALTELPYEIQRRGGGLFRIIIRRGRMIQFSGTLAFAALLNLQ